MNAPFAKRTSYLKTLFTLSLISYYKVINVQIKIDAIFTNIF